MKSGWVRMIVGVAVAGSLGASAASAEEMAKTALPTLLIKGKVVSVKTDDPAGTLLEVEDRYGFKTPIYLSGQTKIAKGEQVMAATDLKSGDGVEVEYNFDINTAKRHAVQVKLGEAMAPATTAAATAGAMVDSAQAAAGASIDIAAPSTTPAAPDAATDMSAPASDAMPAEKPAESTP